VTAQCFTANDIPNIPGLVLPGMIQKALDLIQKD
jgi:hypothetical protein